MAAQPETRRSKYLSRWAALKNERSTWLTHWREISDYMMPRSGRFVSSDRNKGGKRHNNIYDSTGSKALNTLASGLMAGMTSPARPWFRLAVPNPHLMESDAVKNWLDDTSRLMREIFNKSNCYRALHSMYKEIGGFGTGACLILDDFEDVIRLHPLTVGEYAIGTDHRGTVDTLYREFDMTVAQIVKDFGIDNVSPSVKDMHDNGTLDAWVTVMHVIEPRADRDLKKSDAKNMPYVSLYFEKGSADANRNEDKFLRESGFKRFPAIVPRWDVIGGDIYGNSPGMEALGDIKQLQHQQVRKAEAIDYQTKPPVQMPVSMRSMESDLLPGGVSYYDGANAGVKAAFEVNLRLDFLLADIQDVRNRINSNFFADLFMMIANDQRSNITAREIAERHEEKLLMLGPVLERLHNEMLSPLIDITFDKMLASGIMPPIPQELHGMDIQVEFVSMLAQAQRAVGTGAVDRLLGTVGAVAQMKPEALDKIDGDQLIDKYADMLGVDPDLIVADDRVAQIRADRAKQAAQAQQAAMASQMADGAAKLGTVQTQNGSNAAADIIGMFSGYNSPGAQAY